MTITSGGNIGMGTTGSPISAGTYYTTLELKGRTGGTGNEGGYYLTTDADGSTIGQLGVDGNFVYLGSRSNTDAVITSNNSERIRVFAGGNVHIGTVGASDAGFKLDVNGTGRFSGNLTKNNALIYTRVFSDILPANDAQGVIYVREGNVSGADGLRYASRTHLFQSHTGSNYLSIASTGAATFSGTGDDIVIIGKATASQNAYLQLNAGSAANAYINSIGSGNLILGANGAASNHLSISSTGAATFASSITAKTMTLADSTVIAVIESTTGTTFNGLEMKNSGGSFYFGQDNSAGNFYGSGTAYSGSLYVSGNNPLVMFTNGTRRMRITGGGQIVMGRDTPSASGRLTVDGDLYLHNITSGAGQSTLKYNYTSTGLVTYDTSSRLLKKNIENLNYGLEDVLKMSAKKYNWKRDESIDLGFIADEMVKIIPEIVFFSTQMTNQTTGVPVGEPLSINYDRLIPVLVKAIQELKQEIDTLKS
jgi:hypothetical protein